MEERVETSKLSRVLIFLGIAVVVVCLSSVMIGHGEDIEEPTSLKAIFQKEDEILSNFEELTRLTGSEMKGRTGENKYEIFNGSRSYQVLLDWVTEEITFIIVDSQVIYDRDKMEYEN